jgi:PAS domain S-box-containing protein
MIDTGEKREEDLRRFRTAMDISGDAILLIDRGTLRYVDVNKTFCELVGYSRE